MFLSISLYQCSSTQSILSHYPVYYMPYFSYLSIKNGIRYNYKKHQHTLPRMYYTNSVPGTNPVYVFLFILPLYRYSFMNLNICSICRLENVKVDFMPSENFFPHPALWGPAVQHFYLYWQVQLNFQTYCKPIEKGEAEEGDMRQLWRNIEPHLRKAMNSVYLREVSR